MILSFTNKSSSNNCATPILFVMSEKLLPNSNICFYRRVCPSNHPSISNSPNKPPNATSKPPKAPSVQPKGPSEALEAQTQSPEAPEEPPKAPLEPPRPHKGLPRPHQSLLSHPEQNKYPIINSHIRFFGSFEQFLRHCSQPTTRN